MIVELESESESGSDSESESVVLFEKTTILEKLLLEASANPFLTYNKTHVKKLAPHCIVYTQT